MIAAVEIAGLEVGTEEIEVGIDEEVTIAVAGPEVVIVIMGLLVAVEVDTTGTGTVVGVEIDRVPAVAEVVASL